MSGMSDSSSMSNGSSMSSVMSNGKSSNMNSISNGVSSCLVIWKSS
jgi:hypothetical protein